MSYTGIAVALRNHIANNTEIKSLVSSGKIAKDSVMTEGYIFSEVPYTTVDKLNNSTIIVVSSNESWDPPRRLSNFENPRVEVDIWSAPRKDSTAKSIEERNADDNIRQVYEALKPLIHVIGGDSDKYVWDGVKIASSEIIDGPDYRDVANAEWHRMARISVGVTI